MGKYTEAVKRGGDEWHNCVDVETCYRESEQNYREYRIAVQTMLSRKHERFVRDILKMTPMAPVVIAEPPQPAPWSRVLDALRRFVASSAR